MTTHGFVSGRSGKKREIGFHWLEYFLDASSIQPWPNRTCIVAADSWIACVAGVEREREGGIWARARGKGKEPFLSFPPRAPHTLSRAPKFPLPLSLSTPATQANSWIDRAIALIARFLSNIRKSVRVISSYLRSPRQMTQAGACILAGSEACPSKSSQLFPETGFYFFSSWRLCLCLVGGLFRLIIVFSWNLDMEYIIYLIEQTPHMGTGEKRRMAVGRALNQGWGRC